MSSDVRRTGGHYHASVRCNACIAEGERAATERIVKWLREGRSLPEQNGMRPVWPFDVASAIERGDHQETT